MSVYFCPAPAPDPDPDWFRSVVFSSSFDDVTLPEIDFLDHPLLYNRQSRPSLDLNHLSKHRHQRRQHHHVGGGGGSKDEASFRQLYYSTQLSRSAPHSCKGSQTGSKEIIAIVLHPPDEDEGNGDEVDARRRRGEARASSFSSSHEIVYYSQEELRRAVEEDEIAVISSTRLERDDDDDDDEGGVYQKKERKLHYYLRKLRSTNHYTTLNEPHFALKRNKQKATSLFSFLVYQKT